MEHVEVVYTCGCRYRGDLTSGSCPTHPSHPIAPAPPPAAGKDLSGLGPKGSSTEGPESSDDDWTQTAYCAQHELWWNGPYKCCPVCHLAKALPSRETLIEECAQVADVIAERMDRRTFPSAGRTAHDIAAAIRQLKGGGQ